MAGSKAGGLKASQSNRARWGDDYYKRIGTIGGQKGTTGGFYANRRLARKAGVIGGRLSKRGKSIIKSEDLRNIHLLYMSDISMKEISRRLDISYSIVRRAIKGGA